MTDREETITVIYEGDDYSGAIERELTRRGKCRGDFKCIIALPESMRPVRDRQRSLFDGQ